MNTMLLSKDHLNSIAIIPFTDELSEAIKTLNYEWLERYFRIKESDVVALSNPKKYIIDSGGFIFYAALHGHIVGTVSLMKKTDTVYELGKMAVTHTAQGYGVGKRLMEHALHVAQQQGISKLILYSNTGLLSAMHLYKSYGFKEVPLDEALYERADVKMERLL